MDLSNLLSLINMLAGGGPHATMAVLVLIIAGMIWERRRLIAEIEKKDERLVTIVEDYHAGNITVADALAGLRNVLYEMKSKV